MSNDLSALCLEINREGAFLKFDQNSPVLLKTSPTTSTATEDLLFVGESYFTYFSAINLISKSATCKFLIRLTIFFVLPIYIDNIQSNLNLLQYKYILFHFYVTYFFGILVFFFLEQIFLQPFSIFLVPIMIKIN